MGYSRHDTAIVDEGARIGDGTRIWHWVHVSAGARIGERCSLGQNVYVGNDVTIGNNVKIQNNVSVYDAVEIEDDVFCGPSMVFTNVYNPRAAIIRKNEYRRTLVKRGATLGANCTIVCGVTIGEYAFVGAGAVVNRDVPPYALMVGVPARRVGWMCSSGVQLKGTGRVTSEAGLTYEITETSCTPI
jgi:UDP-2-acetamido-3-amino-2,3-dideoxy-glucuronate N-acetyltransferase